MTCLTDGRRIHELMESTIQTISVAYACHVEDMAMPVDRCGSIGRQASRKSPWPAERAVADWGEWLVWFALVPVGDRGHVVLSFEVAGFLGADLLPFDAQGLARSRSGRGWCQRV